MLKGLLVFGVLAGLACGARKDWHHHHGGNHHGHNHKCDHQTGSSTAKPDLCPGFTAQTIPNPGPTSKYFNRFYLYKASLMTGSDVNGGKCGFLDTSTNCRCTFEDVVPGKGNIFKLEFSENVKDKRANMKGYTSVFADPGKGLIMSTPDKGGPMNEIDIATDNYETYVISVVCNNRVNGKNVVYVKTTSAVPTEETKTAIAQALKNYSLDADLVTIDHKECHYPTLTINAEGISYTKS